MGHQSARSRLCRAAALTILALCTIVGSSRALYAQQQHRAQQQEQVLDSPDGYYPDGEQFDYGAPGNGPGYGSSCCDNSCDSCQQPCCSSCNNSCNSSTCWVGGEYLLWKLDGTHLPPLVTDSPGDTPLDEAGRLNSEDTQILSGNSAVGGDWRSGYRIFTGMWLDPCQNWNISGDYFNTGDDNYNFLSNPDTDRIVTRPFFNTQLDEDDAQLVAVPDQLAGTVAVSNSDRFQGAGIAIEKCLWYCCPPCGCGPTRQISMLGGYRYYQYDSQLTITENLTVLPGTTQPLIPGTQILVQDQFTTRNDFHGGELGFQGWQQYCGWWIDGTAKMAIGSNRRTVFIDGQTVNTVPDDSVASFRGGLLTSENTNIGRYVDHQAVVIPEFRLGVGCQLTQKLSARFGYNVIIWSDVARAASQLPPGLEVDPRNLPPVTTGGGDAPSFAGIGGTQLVAHGFDFGLQFMY